MRGRKTVARLNKHPDNFRPFAALRLQPSFQGVSIDVFHGDEDFVGEGADVVDSNDVGVSQACHRLCLAKEACPTIASQKGLQSSRMHQLDRKLASELWVMGSIDEAHPALA